MSDDWRDPTPPGIRLRFRVEQVEGRLAEGAKTFAALRESIESIKPKAVSPWVVAAKVGGLAIAAAAAAIGFGEFRANSKHTSDTVQEMRQDVDRVKSDVRQVQTDQAVLKVQLGEVQGTTSRIERKLDEPEADALGRRKRR